MTPEDKSIASLTRRLTNWGRWGPDDELGTANLITPKKRAEAARCVRTGSTHSLALELRPDLPQPPGSGRLNPQHLMVATGAENLDQAGAGYADDLIAMSVHSATHWDALSHVMHLGKMYNDRDATLITWGGAAVNDIVPMADRLVTRGVLVDVARYRGLEALPTDFEISVADLERTLATERVEVGVGDALLIRTGHLGRIRRTGDWASFAEVNGVLPAEPGIGAECLPWLHDRGIAAVACDNWAVEWLSGKLAVVDLPVHVVGIVHMGLLLGEVFELDCFASACAADGFYDCLFAAAPLPVVGAVGGPVNPIVIR